MSKSLEPLIKAVAFCLVIVTLSAVAYFFYDRSQRDMRGLYREIEQKLNFIPQVTINRTVIIQQSAPALEFVTHKYQKEQTVEWQQTLLRSTKTVKLTGDVIASAGFDLREPFSIEVDTEAKRITVRHPRPKLLSLHVSQMKTAEDPGYWNWITAENRNEALKRFSSEVEQTITTRTPLLEEARQSLHDQLHKILHQYDMRLVFEENAPREQPQEALAPAEVY